eukprot:CAMPEP_0185582606 /NCGR_PEP_ID=MMETSP0434-20130131/21002_1 /TAXON_ID=626734 ORGANISM="Favella taraikaensis, Strain Fe Narragansett Bay" /NCGR_SAMPLE_ID=MMETSP0434 /ASSEMBLY_ACC=CAM_ASM_000379 /LENGTH=126 /DNA_ID=CAMNT_0028201465 /DNA_START=28 /DNA_END=408 /DNA_ORIENTATION=-
MSFAPVIYMKRGCPFCTKVAVFLAEAQIKLTWEYDTEENRKLVTEKCGKASFPTYQFAEGEFMQESDDIMAKLAEEKGIDMASLQVYNYFTGPVSMFTTFRKLFKLGMAAEGGYPELLAKLETVEL